MKGSHSIITRIVTIILVVLVLAVLPALACAAPTRSTATSPAVEPSMPVPAPPSESASGIGGIFHSDEETALSKEYGESDMESLDRKIIKSGDISLVVEDIIDTMDEITMISSDLGGYVVSSNKYKSNDDRLSGSITIRVPAEKFDEAFSRLRDLAVDVVRENTRSTDVTEEYVDLEAQLHNLEATEVQYLSLLEKAETVEDILKVQQALSSIRGQIERIEGRMQYIDRTADMSLIEVSLQEKKSLEQNGWKASDTLVSAARGFLTFLKALANLLIWLAIFCPVWIPVIIIIVIVRRRRKNAQTMKEKQQ